MCIRDRATGDQVTELLSEVKAKGVDCLLYTSSDQRKAMIRSQVTALLYHGKIRTTETRAKEIRKVAEGLIALAVKERDNYETVKVTAKVARKDKDGKRVKAVSYTHLARSACVRKQGGASEGTGRTWHRNHLHQPGRDH